MRKGDEEREIQKDTYIDTFKIVKKKVSKIDRIGKDRVE